MSWQYLCCFAVSSAICLSALGCKKEPSRGAASSNQDSAGGSGGNGAEGGAGADAGSAPSNAVQLVGALKISGDDGTCVVREGGDVLCWGYPEWGQESDIAVRIPGIDNAVDVHASPDGVCVVLADGRVLCWGKNDRAQLGDGQITDDIVTVPVEVLGIDDAIQVTRYCALHSDGTVSCWGQDTVDLGAPIVPTRVAGVEDAVAVSCSAACCALLADGRLACWAGVDLYGQTRNVADLEDVVSVSFGGYHSCVAHADGSAHCWGWDGDGPLTPSENSEPRLVEGLVDAVAVSTAGLRTTALRKDGTLAVWGRDPHSCPYGEPDVVVDGIDDAVAISTSNGLSCAILADTTVRCFGGNASALGAGPGLTYSCEPLPVLMAP